MLILIAIIVLILLLGAPAIRNIIAFAVGVIVIVTILGGVILALANGQ